MSDSWQFGKLEGVLAALHLIHPSKRTAFQARLKNFHRLGFPEGFAAIKGRPAHYSASQCFQIALAVEFTQLGLPPERATTIISRNSFPIASAVRLAVGSISDANKRTEGEQPDILQMYVYFDPRALDALCDEQEQDNVSDLETFFYGGAGVMADLLKRSNFETSPRLSLVNVTYLVGVLSGLLGGSFLADLLEWTDVALEDQDDFEAENARVKQTFRDEGPSERYYEMLTSLFRKK